MDLDPASYGIIDPTSYFGERSTRIADPCAVFFCRDVHQDNDPCPNIAVGPIGNLNPDLSDMDAPKSLCICDLMRKC